METLDNPKNMTILDVDKFEAEMRSFCKTAGIGSLELRFSLEDMIANIRGSAKSFCGYERPGIILLVYRNE